MISDIPFLDRMLEPWQAAEWLQMPERSLMDKHRVGTIPGFKAGHSTVRFHPRSVLAKMAKDAGVSTEMIQSVFGQKTQHS